MWRLMKPAAPVLGLNNRRVKPVEPLLGLGCGAFGRDETCPAGVDSGWDRDKIRHAAEKRPCLGCFVRAGRVLYRLGADGAEQGQL